MLNPIHLSRCQQRERFGLLCSVCAKSPTPPIEHKLVTGSRHLVTDPPSNTRVLSVSMHMVENCRIWRIVSKRLRLRLCELCWILLLPLSETAIILSLTKQIGDRYMLYIFVSLSDDLQA